MFGFLKNGKIYKELDEIIAQIDSNVANNYKDAAQEAVGCLQENSMMFVKDESVMKSSLIYGNAKKN